VTCNSISDWFIWQAIYSGLWHFLYIHLFRHFYPKCTVSQTDRRTDRRQYDANSRSYCVRYARSAKTWMNESSNDTVAGVNGVSFLGAGANNFLRGGGQLRRNSVTCVLFTLSAPVCLSVCLCGWMCRCVFQINFCFLCNIVRVLVTKLRAVNSPDTVQTKSVTPFITHIHFFIVWHDFSSA